MKRKRAKKSKAISPVAPDIESRFIVEDVVPVEPPPTVVEASAPERPPARYRVEKWSEVYPPNPAMLRHILASEGYSVFQWGDHPGMFYGSHKHDEDQSHWVVSGTLELNVEGRGTYVLGPGDRDFMPAGTYHTARVIGEETVIYLIGEMKT